MTVSTSNRPKYSSGIFSLLQSSSEASTINRCPMYSTDILDGSAASQVATQPGLHQCSHLCEAKRSLDDFRSIAKTFVAAPRQAPGRNHFLDHWLLQQRGHWAWVITRQPNGTLSCLWLRTSKGSTPGSFLDNLWMVEHMSEPTLTGIGNYHWVSHLVAHTEPGGSGSVVAVQMKQPHSQG